MCALMTVLIVSSYFGWCFHQHSKILGYVFTLKNCRNAGLLANLYRQSVQIFPLRDDVPRIAWSSAGLTVRSSQVSRDFITPWRGFAQRVTNNWAWPDDLLFRAVRAPTIKNTRQSVVKTTNAKESWSWEDELFIFNRLTTSALAHSSTSWTYSSYILEVSVGIVDRQFEGMWKQLFTAEKRLLQGC